MHSLIITGGRMDLPFAKIYADAGSWDMIICADKGLEFCRKAGIVPDRIIGDLDSAKQEDIEYFREKYPERTDIFPSHKDETDTELAVSYAISEGADQITVLGGTGTRIDHVLGNIQLLRFAADAGAEMFLVDAHNRIRLTDSGLILKKEDQFGDYISLIPFSRQVEGLTLTGFVYEVQDLTLKAGVTLGISNEIKDEYAQIAFSGGTLLVIESSDREAGIPRT